MDARALEAELAKPFLQGLVAPRYEGRSLGSLLPTILRALGAKAPPGLLPPLRDLPGAMLEGVERVALLVLDGVGWHQLRAGLEGPWARLAERGALLPVTSTGPSTTTAALASLNTGLAPAQHGLLGHTMWLQEFGCVANMLSFAPAVGGRGLEALVTPEEFFEAPTAAELLKPAGAWHLNVTRREFLGTALTRMLYKGGETVGTTTLGELLVELRHALEAMAGSAGLVQGYWPSIDSVAHARGPGSEHHRAELALLGEALAREFVGKARDADALLLVTADHGLATVPPEGVLKVREAPALAEALVLPPWGDSRWAWLEPREGCTAEVQRMLRELLGKDSAVLEAAEAERLGLLGPGPWPEGTRRRAGKLLALPGPGRALVWPFQPSGEAARSKPPREELLGRHGGASAEEMLVPLLLVRL